MSEPRLQLLPVDLSDELLTDVDREILGRITDPLSRRAYQAVLEHQRREQAGGFQITDEDFDDDDREDW